MKSNWLILLLAAMLFIPMSCANKELSNTKTMMVGAFGEESKLTAEELELFNKTVKTNEVCKDWTPLAVSKQVVAGINYKFSCKDKKGKKHMVKVFRPLPGRGEPSVTAIDEK